MGRMRMLLLAVLGMQAFGLAAQEEAPDEKVRDAATNDQGFMMLLEFIGEFTDEEGEWVDPIALELELGSLDDAGASGKMTDNEMADPAQDSKGLKRSNPG